MQNSGARSLMGLSAGRYDGHCHVFTAELPMAPARRYTPDYDATPEALCGLLDQFELDGALLVQPSFLGADNSYLLDALEKLDGLPGKIFRGVVVLDPTSKPDSGWLQELDQRGIVGTRLNLVGGIDVFDYEDWKSTLAATERLGWHVELHVEATHLPVVLPRLIKHHGRIVIDHFGLVRDIDGNPGLKSLLSQPVEKIWIKTSAAYRIFPEDDRQGDLERLVPLIGLYRDHFGLERLIWGSDWPFTQFEDRMSYSRANALLRIQEILRG